MRRNEKKLHWVGLGWGGAFVANIFNRQFAALVGLLFLCTSTVWASEGKLDVAISDAIAPFVGVVISTVFYSITIGGVSLPIVVLWLVAAAIFFTVYFGFINVRGFKHAICLVSGKCDDDAYKATGEVTHFQALATALSGTVGLGNIAGVAVAISYGGPGATFWMILAGFLGMSSKFIECTLGVKYREVHVDGSVSGGPMFYLSRGLAERGMRHLGLALAGFFAICCILGSLGGGNLFQANQAYDVVLGITGGENSIFANRGWLFGVILGAVVGLVIIGGIKRIVRVTEKMVPIMAVMYLAVALYIIFSNASKIPDAIELILVGAFSPEGIAGGAIGVMIQGFKRAAFSNEAGIGSASIAHSAVRTDKPVTEGYVSLLEPFVDTVVICTMTALVLIITGLYEQGAVLAASGNLSGAQLTSDAFASTVSWFPIILALSVMLFAFSTMISWSYYGLKAWTYLFGRGVVTELIFKLLFCAFVVIGCTMNLAQVVDFSDSAIFAMSFANIIGLYILAPAVKRELMSYQSTLSSTETKRTAR